MSVVFGNTVRGNFYINEFKVSDSIVQIEDFKDEMQQDHVFVEGVSVRKAEKRAIIQCFNSTNHIYAFGADPESSGYSCSLGVFISKCPEKQFQSTGKQFQSTGGIQALISKYDQKRVSQNPTIVKMSIDNSIINGILVGMAVDVLDVELNLFRVTLMFNDLDP